MTFASIPRGFLFPDGVVTKLNQFSSTMLIDAATEKVAFIGQIYIDGRPATSKTLSAAGGGSISFRAGAVTWANGATSVDFGIQGVSSTSGPPAQPDGVFSVSATLVPGVETITANAWNTFAMESGSATISHGDLIAIVWDMTARAGADSVVVSSNLPQENILGNVSAGSVGRPLANLFTGGAWLSAGNGNIRVPNCLITFDDGTIANIDGAPFFSSVAGESFSDATNPDERGLVFQVPFDCKVDGAYWLSGTPNGATSDCSINLYSDPLGTPTIIASLSILGEQVNSSAALGELYTFSAEVQLTKNTNYCLAFRATGAGTISLSAFGINNTAFRSLLQGGTTVTKATRNNGAGAFTQESPAVTFYNIALRISALATDASGSGGSQRVIGAGM